MTNAEFKLNISLPEDYQTFMLRGGELKHKNFYYAYMSGQYIGSAYIKAFCPLYSDAKATCPALPQEFSGDYLPIAYTGQSAPICLGLAPRNFGQIFLYEFDNIEYRAGSSIRDPEEGDFEVEECESYKFHLLADSFSGFVAGLTCDSVVETVPVIYAADMRNYYGDASNLPASERLALYSAGAKELAEARERVNFSYLARRAKERRETQDKAASLTRENRNLRQKLHKFEENRAEPFYRKLIDAFAGFCAKKFG